MMQASAYGRLGQDPRDIATRTGTAMVTSSMAVDAARGDDSEAPPLWLGIVAFGRVAEELARHQKGDLVSVSGRVQQNRWTDKAGNEREQLQIVADSIVSARTVRPGGRRRASATQPESEAEEAVLDDDIPF